MYTKQGFNNLYSKGSLKEALELLYNAAQGEEMNEVLSLKSRLEHLNSDVRRGTLSNSEATIEKNKIGVSAQELAGRIFDSSADHHAPAVVGGFNAADFMKILASGTDWDITIITFPQADSSAVTDFIDHIKAPGALSWENAKQRGKLSLLYKYVKTLFSLSQDPMLRFKVIKPIEDLLELKSFNMAPADFEIQIRDLIVAAEEHINRLEGQEGTLREQKSKTTETLRQTYDRLRVLQAVATQHGDWLSLIQRIAAENPSLAYRFTKLQADVEGLSMYTGRNLYDAIFATGQPTISQRIAAAIKLVEDNAELI